MTKIGKFLASVFSMNRGTDAFFSCQMEKKSQFHTENQEF